MRGPSGADPKMGVLGRQSCWDKEQTGLSWNWDYWGSEMPNWFPSTQREGKQKAALQISSLLVKPLKGMRAHFLNYMFISMFSALLPLFPQPHHLGVPAMVLESHRGLFKYHRVRLE